MKPISLEMTAFGSYAEKAIINFKDFDRGLFLISGETGAGKTMIFDAIAFALYGKTSGIERDPLRMHCDLVSPSVDTVVKLVFMQNNHEYKVERTLHFSKKRGSNEEYNDAKQYAVLIEPDHTTVKGQEKVNDRCAELLGMDVEQFRKIVMLAQGDFREFLRANSDKKNDILGRLFDNSAFKQYQEMLNGAKNILYEQRRDNQEKLRSLIDDGFSEVERSLYHPESPDFLEKLMQLVADDGNKLKELDTKKTIIREELQNLNIEYGAAKGVNDDLAELDIQKEFLEDLTSQEIIMKELEKTITAIAAILHTVRLKIDAKKRAFDVLDKANKDIQDLECTLDEYNRALKEAREAEAGDADAVKRVDELKKEIHSLREQLPRYHELQEKTKAQINAKDAEKVARESREDGEEKQQELKKEQKTITEQLEALKDIDYLVINLAEVDNTAKKAVESLTGKDGITETIQTIKTAEEDLKEEIVKLSDLTEKALEAEAIHHDHYQRFIAGQAGLLADKLRKDIYADGKAVCPVCGMIHTKVDDAHFAVMLEGTPEESKVKAAERAYRQAEDDRKQKEAIVQEKKKVIDDKKNDLLRKADPYFPSYSWEQISDDVFLKKAEKALKDKSKSAGSALKEAKKQQTERNNLIKKQNENKTILDDLDAKIEELRHEENTQQVAFAAADSAVTALRKTLKFGSAEEAQEQMSILDTEQSKLQDRIDGHIKTVKEALNTVTATEGKLDGKRKELPDLNDAYALAECEENKVLKENGFVDADAALAVLTPIGDVDEETWLREQTKAVHDYASDCKNTRNRIKELEGKTKGKSLTDLDELNARIKAKSEEQATAETEYNAKDSLLKAHQSFLSKAKKYKTALASTDSAWQRLNTLGTLAVGSIGEGGKISFDRYVMGAVFREILEMANRRISIMSGGQYELVHKKDSDRKNAKAGLEIEVLVTGTGKSRPSSNLSGGEGFYASLALALGLSDVVQMHSGEKKLDALFIDEGFGTLSPDVLDKALDVLNQLSAGDRLVGIISHVDKLDESIPQKIRVMCDEKGSHVRQEF